MAESYEGTLHDAAVKIALVTSNLRDMPEADLGEDKRTTINAAAREIYLSCTFVVASNPKRYGRLVEELENDYTKGKNNYPTNMVKAYQLINEYKSWTPGTSLPEVSGVAFSQQGNSKEAQNTAEWKNKAVCNNCGKKGHIKADCTESIIDNDDTNEKDNKIVENKSGKKKISQKRNSFNFPT